MNKNIEKIALPLPEDRKFHEIIDVRAPVEFAADHVEGAINLPVLWDEERERVGTEHKQGSPFEAQKAGAALVSAFVMISLAGACGLYPGWTATRVQPAEALHYE